MTEPLISFRVNGIPKPGGSKRAFIPKGWNRAIITDACDKSREWKNLVSDAAVQAVNGRPEFPLSCPLEVHITFFMPRPAGHFGSGKNAGVLKPNAPVFHDKRPDASKLWRSTEDALTSIIFQDDSLIAKQIVEKRYSGKTETPGCEIEISSLATRKD